MFALGWEVVGLETAGNDGTYAWDELVETQHGPHIITAFPDRRYDDIGKPEIRKVLHRLLDDLKPDAVAIAGWSLIDSQTCLDWCKKNRKKCLVMSETREADGKRVWWKERVKSYFISRFDGALVGGRSQRDYLVKLGMPAKNIQLGYNVVNNAFFAVETEKWQKLNRAQRDGQELFAMCSAGGLMEGGIKTGIRGEENLRCAPMHADQLGVQNQEPRSKRDSPYFLASNRFIERKNLGRLIEAYSIYSNSKLDHWPLVLLGDGELKAELIAQCHALGLNVIKLAPWDSSLTADSCSLITGTVYFPGFRQIQELPRFYSQAGCFIHPALEEPWGLVINEAMACGLPILSGRNVGAAEELVHDSVNGWCFDAEHIEEMAECLAKVAGMRYDELQSLSEASRRILEKCCPTEAFGGGLAELLTR